jgi:hypothetical protein
MKRPAKDPIREDRIHDEAIVNAYRPEEQAICHGLGRLFTVTY